MSYAVDNMSLTAYITSVISDIQTPKERAPGRRYALQLAGLMALCAVTLVASIHALKTSNFSRIVMDSIGVRMLALPLIRRRYA
jgi:hypothetical protein